MLSSNHPYIFRSLTCEMLETRLSLTGPSFATHVIVETHVWSPVSVFVADIDDDGDGDILSTLSSFAGGWYENEDGNGTFGRFHPGFSGRTATHSVYPTDLDGDGDTDVLVATKFFIGWYENTGGMERLGLLNQITRDRADTVHVADLDGDGDVDVLAASDRGLFSPSRIVWYENTDGKGSFSEQNVIGEDPVDSMNGYIADVDGDGDLDVLSATRNTGARIGERRPQDSNIAWYENTDGKGSFGPRTVISRVQVSDMYVVDLDRDGDIDVLSTFVTRSSSGIAWYENTDGKGSFGEQNIISEDVARINVADVDGDGDVDLFATWDGTTGWYENTDGKGSFSEQRVIGMVGSTGRRGGVFVEDVDSDGDVDLLFWSSDADTIGWYENTDGKGSFSEQRVIGMVGSTGLGGVFVGDVDGDGDVDLLSAFEDQDEILWYENTDAGATFRRRFAVPPGARGAKSVHAADIDGDGDLDVLSASSLDNKVAWYENTDGKGTFGPQITISRPAGGAPNSVLSEDFDGDGDIDVLSVNLAGGAIVWHENTDGLGTFSSHVIARNSGNNHVHAADVDGDGDMDVLSASFFDPNLVWYENTDGRGTFRAHDITSTAPGATYVVAADVDKDGDLDLIIAASIFTSSGTIAWLENEDGSGTFGPKRTINRRAPGVTSVYAADVDGDGDVDVLSASGGDDTIGWYENTDGKGGFDGQRVITTEAAKAKSVHAADVDGDGDLDVLSASSRDNKIAWYENTDGNGAFGDQQLITNPDSDAWSVYAGDIDGDGDTDVISASNFDGKIAWYENSAAEVAAGDVNRDLQFDQRDIVQVLQAAKYLTGEPATFEEGNWNADDVFDQLDIIAALQTGNYLQGPYAAADRAFAETGP